MKEVCRRVRSIEKGSRDDTMRLEQWVKGSTGHNSPSVGEQCVQESAVVERTLRLCCLWELLQASCC